MARHLALDSGPSGDLGLALRGAGDRASGPPRIAFSDPGGVAVCALAAALCLSGCRGQASPEPLPAPDPAPEPEYTRPLPSGTSGLAKLTADRWPDLRMATRASRDAELMESLDLSLKWFGKPSSQEYFPVAGVTHEHANASVYAFRQFIDRSRSAEELADQLKAQFDVYSSVGWDGRGTVLFTGYYAPTFEASRIPSDVYRYPLYRRPADLVTDPTTGTVLGRRVGDDIVRYPTRAEIESSGILAGLELVWLRDAFDRYLIHVQGSTLLALRDGSTMYVGYAGNNGHNYVSVARLLAADGKLAEDELSVENVRAYLTARPEELEAYIRRNNRFIFFQEVDPGAWPTGSLGVRVTPRRTVATDKRLFPAGSVTLVVTRLTPAEGRVRPFQQFMLDQDTGGAIRSAGRADIYFGIGDEAGETAGDQYAEGRLYYLLLRPEAVATWVERLNRRR